MYDIQCNTMFTIADFSRGLGDCSKTVSNTKRVESTGLIQCAGSKPFEMVSLG